MAKRTISIFGPTRGARVTPSGPPPSANYGYDEEDGYGGPPLLPVGMGAAPSRRRAPLLPAGIVPSAAPIEQPSPTGMPLIPAVAYDSPSNPGIALTGPSAGRRVGSSPTCYASVERNNNDKQARRRRTGAFVAAKQQGIADIMARRGGNAAPVIPSGANAPSATTPAPMPLVPAGAAGPPDTSMATARIVTADGKVHEKKFARPNGAYGLSQQELDDVNRNAAMSANVGYLTESADLMSTPPGLFQQRALVDAADARLNNLAGAEADESGSRSTLNRANAALRGEEVETERTMRGPRANLTVAQAIAEASKADTTNADARADLAERELRYRQQDLANARAGAGARGSQPAKAPPSALDQEYSDLKDQYGMALKAGDKAGLEEAKNGLRDVYKRRRAAAASEQGVRSQREMQQDWRDHGSPTDAGFSRLFTPVAPAAVVPYGALGPPAPSAPTKPTVPLPASPELSASLNRNQVKHVSPPGRVPQVPAGNEFDLPLAAPPSFGGTSLGPIVPTLPHQRSISTPPRHTAPVGDDGLVSVESPAAARRLPPGTRFITPDGRVLTR